MTRTPRLALAGTALAGAATALAALLWLVPAGGTASAPQDPVATGSLNGAPPADAEASDDVAATETPDGAAEDAVASEPATVEPAAVEPVVAAAPPRPSPFRALRDADGLRLVGAVPDEAERSAILIAARARFVAEPVVSELVVDPQAEATPPPVAAVALSALARLAEGEARLAANVLALDGRALYPQARERIEDEMRVRLPEGWTAELAVETPQPTPEPMIAPVPARAAAPTPVATAEAATSEADAAPRPGSQQADLAATALHPLPPRR
ncbi:hypothetical protein [Salinarimonas ramus]|uniref:BON domain-containing protein n=1 Tax=Salinarimonas ramus TaxID=690164 RepID=A0A917V731_9HYPH|nr:hypothetical protein [Salinarimonas ramus]GGK45434.1 hypothetical protein GCM10011322_35800 [Salinarimonas ramus]